VLGPCAQLSLPRSSLAWEPGDTTRVFIASMAYAALRLLRGDGYPAYIAAEAVEARAVVTRGDAAGSGVGGGAGGDTTLPVTLAPVSLGVYCLSIAVPVDVVGRFLALQVHVVGAGDVGAPPPVECTRLAFDPAAGDPAQCTLSGDGTTLTTLLPGQLFRGRTPLLHTGPWVSFDIGLELQLRRGNNFAIALGGVDHIKDDTYNYSNNSGLAFFWDVYHGGVNVPWGTSTGHPKLQGPGTLVCHFCIRGNTLTFAAGPTPGSMKEQAGSWTLPNDFYLLISGYSEGTVVRLFSPA
jgi:hypothetical protein